MINLATFLIFYVLIGVCVTICAANYIFDRKQPVPKMFALAMAVTYIAWPYIVKQAFQANDKHFFFSLALRLLYTAALVALGVYLQVYMKA